MKIAFVGSRNFADKAFVTDKIKGLFDFWHGNIEGISGGAKGPDSWAQCIFEDLLLGDQFEVVRPDWTKDGRAAPFIRNRVIVDKCDRVIAFWDGTSKGTKHAIDYAVSLRKPVDVYLRF